MAEFLPALAMVLEHEGGLSDHPNDSGMITNWGVSLRFALAERDLSLFDIDLDGDIDADDIRKMSKKDAARIYKTCFWDRGRYWMIGDQQVATKVFDMAVNMGLPQAHKLLQRALNRFDARLVEDGKLGPATFGAVNRMGNYPIIEALRAIQKDFYMGLVKMDPTLSVFLNGWLNRARA